MLDKWLSSYNNWANFILRSLVGVIFIAHGAQKLFGAFGGPGLEGAARYFEQLGFVPGDAWALAVAIVEFIGGAALLVGGPDELALDGWLARHGMFFVRRHKRAGLGQAA